MPTSGPEGSIDKVLQPDGSYKWEVVAHPRAEELDPPTKKAAPKAKASKPKTPKPAPEKSETFDNEVAE
tara:strand:- start:311 stop:517 length:207 start_codon:yes stop_codon:yes gene_type:complete